MSVGVGVSVGVSEGVGVSVDVGGTSVSVGVGVSDGVGVWPGLPGLMEMPPMAQWSELPRVMVIVTFGLAPASVAPAPNSSRPPSGSERFHC